MFFFFKSFNFVEILKKICNNVRRKIKWMFFVFCSFSVLTCVFIIFLRDYVVQREFYSGGMKFLRWG